MSTTEDTGNQWKTEHHADIVKRYRGVFRGGGKIAEILTLKGQGYFTNERTGRGHYAPPPVYFGSE